MSESQDTYPLDTIHSRNIYTCVEDSLAIPMKDQSTILGIARKQTAAWQLNTILNKSSSDDQDMEQLNLDIDSTHFVFTLEHDYAIDISNSATLHQLHVPLAIPATTTDTAHDSEMNDTTPSYIPSTIQPPSDQQIAHFNKHPIFRYLSEADQKYIQSISQELTSHLSVIEYDRFNPYNYPIQVYDETQFALVETSPFPKALSLFQSHGVAALLHNHHLLVTAHTGSGKTMAAHALIMQTLAQGGKVVYTTPIKALSNQKYAELSAIYPSVGLLTGDVTVNRDAHVVVMTTEILRNLSIHSDSQYKAAIFDEVHYMEDASRGVIWEETLLTLPETTQMVFLSATVVNGDEFGKWISKITKRPCHVVTTRVRAVPIAHLIIEPPQQLAPGLARRMTDDRKKRQMNAQRQIDDGTKDGDKPKGDGLEMSSLATQNEIPLSSYTYHVDLPPVEADSQETPSDLQTPFAHHMVTQIISTVVTAISNHWLPLISFSFSRKDCDFFAKELYQLGFSLTTPTQKKKIIALCEKHFAADIPDRAMMISLLSHGIGIHHSGHIGRVREVVEKLLEQSLVKLLFATETFAVGINVPVRSVLFTALSKFDGKNTRLLTPSEYTQMSGRAGRRGMDRVGVTMVIQDHFLTPTVYRNIVCGASLCLESRFRVSIGLLLSSFRAGTAKGDKNSNYSLQQVIESSFAIFRFQNNKSTLPTSMLTRALILFAQLVYRLYKSCIPNNPTALDRFTPWINIRKMYESLDANVMDAIIGIQCHTYQLISFVCDEDGSLGINPLINIRTLAKLLITPPLLYPIYLHSLYLLSTEGLLPLLLQSNSQRIQWATSIAQYAHNGQLHNLFSFSELYHIIFSLFDPHTNHSLGFQTYQNATNNLNNDSNNASIDQNNSSSYTTASTQPPSIEILRPPVPTKSDPFSTIHLLGTEPDPNDVINYCIPGRVVYIEFPPELHDTTHNDHESSMNQLLHPRGTADKNRLNGALHMPSDFGWGIILGIRSQFSTSIIIDVLVPVPVVYKPVSRPGMLDRFVTRGYDLQVLSLCECSITKISSVVVHIPPDVDTVSGKMAIWSALLQAVEAWSNTAKVTQQTSKQDPNQDQSSSQPNTKPSLTQYQTPHGLTSTSDVSLLIELPTKIDQNDLYRLFSYTELPLIYSRPVISNNVHNAAFHRMACTLFDLPKNKIKENEPNPSSANSSPSSIESPFQHTDKFLFAALMSSLQSYPPPLRTMINLFLHAQTIWMAGKVDGFKYTTSLATTSYNNPDSTEQATVTQEDETLVAMVSMTMANNSSNASNSSINNNNDHDSVTKQRQLDQIAQDRRGASIQSILAKYLNTVSVMTQYMQKYNYIKKHADADDDDNETSSSTSVVKNGQTLDVSAMLSNFKLCQKGTLCSYIENANGLILAELLMGNEFVLLNDAEFAAALSIFVTGASASDKATTSGALESQIPHVYNFYQKVIDQCIFLEQSTQEDDDKPKLLDSSKNSTSLNASSSLLYDPRELGLQMSLPVHTWCNTHDIQKALDAAPSGAGSVFPGNLARVLLRLLNLIDQLLQAANEIGQKDLTNKLNSTAELIKKGTLFESSLHLQELQDKINEKRGIASRQ